MMITKEEAMTRYELTLRADNIIQNIHRDLDVLQRTLSRLNQMDKELKDEQRN